MAQRYLVVNADDFGQSPGVNRGIIEAHERGILTSASLMVRFGAAREAAEYAAGHPHLGVGLHLDLGEWACRDGTTWVPVYQVVDRDDRASVSGALARQLDLFRALTGREPSHLDSHQHVHLREPVRSLAAEAADRLGIPLRGCTPKIRYCGDFYGQTGTGGSHPGALSVAGLRGILLGLGPTDYELGCHPGYAEDLDSMYRTERALEVAVLCDPAAREAVAEAGFELTSFAEWGRRRVTRPE